MDHCIKECKESCIKECKEEKKKQKIKEALLLIREGVRDISAGLDILIDALGIEEPHLHG